MLRVYFHEMRKILQWKPLLLIAAFSGICSFAILGNTLSYLTVVHEPSDIVAVASDLIKFTGPTLEADEFGPAMDTLSARYIDELESAIYSNPDFATVGVTDYQSFLVLEQKIKCSQVIPESLDPGEIPDECPMWDPTIDYSLNQTETALEMALMSLGGETTPEMLAYLKTNLLVKSFENPYNNIAERRAAVVDFGSPAVNARIQDIFDSGEILNTLPLMALSAFNEMFFVLSIMVVVGVCILLAPTVTRDTQSKVTPLQYSSKIGKRIRGTQLGAMITVSTLLATIEIAVVFAIFTVNGWYGILKSGLNSYATWDYYWFSGNIGQYLLIVGGMMIAVALAATLMIFVFSTLCQNYISLLLAVIPLVGILVVTSSQVFGHPFTIIAGPASIFTLAYLEVYITILLLVIALVSAAIILKKEKAREV